MLFTNHKKKKSSASGVEYMNHTAFLTFTGLHEHHTTAHSHTLETSANQRVRILVIIESSAYGCRSIHGGFSRVRGEGWDGLTESFSVGTEHVTSEAKYIWDNSFHRLYTVNTAHSSHIKARLKLGSSSAVPWENIYQIWEHGKILCASLGHPQVKGYWFKRISEAPDRCSLDLFIVR